MNGLYRPGWEAYDTRIKGVDPEWGMKDAVQIEKMAGDHGFQLLEKVSSITLASALPPPSCP